MIYERELEGIILKPMSDEPIQMTPQGYLIVVGPDQFAMPVIMRVLPIMSEKVLFVQASGLSGVPVWETKIPFTEDDIETLKTGPMSPAMWRLVPMHQTAMLFWHWRRLPTDKT